MIRSYHLLYENFLFKNDINLHFLFKKCSYQTDSQSKIFRNQIKYKIITLQIGSFIQISLEQKVTSCLYGSNISGYTNTNCIPDSSRYCLVSI